jgi:L-threonylcarbamoyladenylate synthase
MSAPIRPATESAALEEALALLRAGHVVALPTDTVYGVAVDSLNPDAIAALYQAKGRPPQKALPLLMADEQQIEMVVREMPPVASEIIRRFMPGALTIVLPAKPHLPPILTAAGDTVAVRIPDNQVVRDLAAGLGYPLAVSSANRSGDADSHTAQEVSERIGDHIALILDGGTTPDLGASTVLNLTVNPPVILREGPITREMLAPWLDPQS